METLQQSSFGFSFWKMFSDSRSEAYACPDHGNIVLTGVKTRADQTVRHAAWFTRKGWLCQCLLKTAASNSCPLQLHLEPNGYSQTAALTKSCPTFYAALRFKGV